MPVIAIGAALVADVVAGGAIAGLAAGATLTATTAFELAAAVGATIAAVGVIARDKTLTMVGGAIGIVGAVGGLAAGAGLLGSEAASGSSIFGASPAASTADTASAAGTSADTGATFADSLTPATTGTTGGAIDAGTFGTAAENAAAAADQASQGTIPFVADGLPQGQDSFTTAAVIGEKAPDPAANLLPTGLEKPSVANLNAGASDLIAPPPAPPNSLGTTDPLTGATTTSAVDPATGKIVELPEGAKSIFGQVMDAASKNDRLASGVVTVGGKLLEGAFSSVTPAQVQALQAQATANDAAAALTKQQTQNLAMPKSVASSTPVTGTPGALLPQGIINRAPAVTGVPA